MRSVDNDSGIKRGGIYTIPDFKGAVEGLNGIKAPAGYKQEDDIKDRLLAVGVLQQQGCDLVRK